MLNALSQYLAKKKISGFTGQRKKSFLNWNQIEKIALIVDNTSSVNKSEIDKFTESLGKYCDVYFLELNSKSPSYSDWICFSKKDKTFLNLPKPHVDAALKNRQYQLVISVCEKYDQYAAILSAQLNPPCNCGIKNLYGETDLIIEREKDKTLIPYLKDVVKYLQLIRTN